MDQFENVTVVKKANIYFKGNVTSRTIIFNDGEKKTLGIMLPGEYEFGTATIEYMTVVSGELDVFLPGSENWKIYKTGETFIVEKDKKFKVKASEPAGYVCIYK